NYGIDQTKAMFITCLDADSFVAPDALKRMLYTFQEHPEVMAVAPSIIINQPKNILQSIQRVEYNMSLYIKKMLSFLNAIHVTPGPFSVFRREVFERIGKFRKAHNTEDAEIAFRMQVNHMKIEHCHLAQVYTVAPNTVGKLFRQRLRWIYGFIQNVIDYRYVIFRKKYGNFSMFTIPSGIISIATIIYIFLSLLYHTSVSAYEKMVQINTVGISSSFHLPHFDLFFMNTRATALVSTVLYCFVILSVIQGYRLARERNMVSWYLIPYMVVYSILTPLWLMKAVWNSITAQKPKWR
ncbi:MAG TPA: glycosyltransferase family 2 protein, partial [Candidatus Paceibacterota bacterium]|nr:glycosyltransferase family 2 protein [Candidatus Paceibacterota bacterium]